MRRLLALASVAAVMALAGCAAEGPDATDEITPQPGSTYTASAAPSISEFDLVAWATRFMPETDQTGSGVRKTEVIHAGEAESATYAYEGGLRLQLACAADEPTSLTVTITPDAGAATETDVICAVGATALPTVFDWQHDEGTSATVTLTAAVDTAVAIQQAAR